MTASSLRTLTLKGGQPNQKRALLTLSDGYRAAVVMDVGNIYVLIASATGSFTLQQTITTDLVAADTYVSAAAVDASNNLHIAWRGTDLKIKYASLAYTSASHTYGAATLRTLNSATTDAPVSIDIDCPGDTAHDKYTVVAAHYILGSTNKSTFIRIMVVDDSTGTVYTLTPSNVTITTATSVNSGTLDITVQCLKTGNPVTDATFAFALVHTLSSGTNDLGDVLKVYTFTTSTHAIAQTASYSIPVAGKGAGARRNFLFNKESTSTFYLGGMARANYQMAMKFSINVTGALLLVGAPCYIQAADHSATALPKANIAFWAYMSGNGKLVMGSNTTFNFYGLEIVTFNADNTVSWDDGTFLQDVSPGTTFRGNVGSAGSARYWAALPTIMRYFNNDAGTAFRADAARMVNSSAPLMTRPADSSVIGNSFPLFEAKFNLPDDLPKCRYKMAWQASQDPTFATGVLTTIQPDSAFQYPKNTTASGKADVRAVVFVSSQRLAQGYWFVRAYQIDQFGNQGAFSPYVLITISHRPSSSNWAPSNDSVLIFTSSTAFSWVFNDASPGDAQTMYQIDIVRTSDGASVATSGVIASTTMAGTVSIDPSFKDVELAWVLTVWDTDNMASAPSGRNTFYLSDPPAPVITSPANMAVLTSGQPTVTWSTGVTGTKTEAAYRLAVLQGTTTCYDTGWIDGTATSYQIPPGILHNSQSYTLVLYVRDSIGQTSSTSAVFSTSYVVPSGVTLFNVFTLEFDRKGFIHVGWEYVGFDTDFYSWNVYRQAVGEASPTLLAQFTELHASYGFRDYSARANVQYTYWVTQTVNRFGDLVESGISKKISINTLGSIYWLLDSLNMIDPVPLYLVNSDSFTDEHEESVMNVIGRGRHVDVGQRLGFNGSLNCQCRDRANGLQIGSNWMPNAALQYAADRLTPDGWSAVGTGAAVTYSPQYDTFYEPSPSGKYSCYSYSIDSFPNTAANFQIFSPTIKISDTDWVNGTVISAGLWIGLNPSQAGSLVASVVGQWLAADGTTVLSTSTIAGVVSEVYEPTNSDPSPSSLWKRYFANLTVPSGATYLKVSFLFTSTVSGTYVLYNGGGMVNTGSTLLPQFDGDTPGCTWKTFPGSASYSPGVFSARDQRSDIFYLKELGRTLYLRNPFGDLILISLGDESNDRVAGVGSREFTDISLPYREVAF